MNETGKTGFRLIGRTLRKCCLAMEVGVLSSTAATMIAAVILLGGAWPASAATTYSTANSYTFSPASNNLIAGLLPSATNNTDTGWGGTTVLLTDGGIPGSIATVYTVYNNGSLTYTLGSAPYGYTITNVNVYSWWSDNGRSAITLSNLAYSTVTDPNSFITISGSAVNYSPGTGKGFVRYWDTGGVMAINVAKIRFNFGPQQNNFVGYAELEVTGFGTSGNPSVANLQAGNISTNSAVFNGQIVTTGSAPVTAVSLFYGNSDGGTNTTLWANTNVFSGGTWTNGALLTTNLTGLTQGAAYWYAYAVSNSIGGTWAQPSTMFTTLSTGFVSAVGGNITTNGAYRIHTFTNSAFATNLIVASAGNVDLFLVAGGGGGGCNGGGGGGGGGVVFSTSLLVTNNQTVPIVVGKGGTGSSSASYAGRAGSNSVFGTVFALGGGGGATRDGDADAGAGGSGGGGGGGARPTGGTGTAGQGCNGGNGYNSGADSAGGGGGGSGSAGVAATFRNGGDGGTGLVYAINGIATNYAGGGGGGLTVNGTVVGKGGAGGGGDSTLGAGNSGAPNTGGGGGGATTVKAGGDGGSGIVMVRYLLPPAAPTIPPTAVNLAPTNVHSGAASFNGGLDVLSAPADTMAVLWGNADGGTNGPWANTNTFSGGPWNANAVLTTNLTLTSGLNYYYTYCASNAGGTAVAAPSQYLITGPLIVQATDAFFGARTNDTATFVVSRPATCTNSVLKVNYTLGGSAANYTATPASGTLQFDAGATNATLTLTPVAPYNTGAATTATVTLAAGSYPVGAPASASATMQTLLPSLSYSSTAFTERWQNDGGIANTLTITLAYDTFTGANGDAFAGTKVLVSGVPAGLVASITRLSSTQLVAALNGNAVNHTAADNVNSLAFVFQDSAFAGNNAAIVDNYNRSNLQVTYLSSNPTNWYVATNGVDATGDGSSNHPYATVQKAVNMAQSAANDVIHLLPGTYTQSGISVGKIVTITGNTSADTILQAAATPFTANANIMNITATGTVRNLTLQNGNLSGGGGAVSVGNVDFVFDSCRFVNNASTLSGTGGGAVFAYNGSSTLTFLNCQFNGNRAAWNGGAAYAFQSNILASNCTFLSNSSANDGGALSTYSGGVTVYDSLFLGNAATNHGGGVYGFTLTMWNSTLSSNAAVVEGGGTYDNQGVIVNSTITGNRAGDRGGGVGSQGTCSLYNTTVFANMSTTNGGGIYCDSGGISLYSSIVASNTAAASPDIWIYTQTFAVTATNSLVGNNSLSGMTAGNPDGKGNYIGTPGSPINPLLAPLADNGGKRPTCALLPGSPAIDHGLNPLGLLWDERGPGYARAYKTLPDMGAFEYGAHLPVTGLVIYFQ